MVDNGDFILSSTSGKLVAHYSCYHGFQLRGAAAIVCEGTRWSDQAPRCERKWGHFCYRHILSVSCEASVRQSFLKHNRWHLSEDLLLPAGTNGAPHMFSQGPLPLQSVNHLQVSHSMLSFHMARFLWPNDWPGVTVGALKRPTHIEIRLFIFCLLKLSFGLTGV